MLKNLSKVISVLVIFALVSVLAVGCGGGTTAPADDKGAAASSAAGNTKEAAKPAGKVTLAFWSGFTGSDRPVLEQIVKSFNETSTTTAIEMSTMTWDVLNQKLTASFAASSGPDFFNYGPEILGKYYKMGALTTVDELYDSGMVDKNIFPKSVVEVPVFDGKSVAAPMCVFNVMVYYNKDMFKEAGISDIPKTQDELFEVAKKLTKLDAKGNVTQYGLALAYDSIFSSLMWGYGLEAIDTTANKCLITQLEQMNVVQKFADYVLKDKISPAIASTGMDTLFNNKKLAMYINGPWATSGHVSAGVSFDVFDIPAGPSGNKIAGHPLFYIPTKFMGDKVKNYYEWEKYWTDKAQQAIWAKGTGYPSVRVDMANDEALKGTWAAKFSGAADKFTVRNYAKYQNSGKIHDEELKNAWESIALGKATVKDALTKASTKINTYLADK